MGRFSRLLSASSRPSFPTWAALALRHWPLRSQAWGRFAQRRRSTVGLPAARPRTPRQACADLSTPRSLPFWRWRAAGSGRCRRWRFSPPAPSAGFSRRSAAAALRS